VVVLDLSMPGQHGLETLPLLHQAAPDSRVAVVSSASRREFADRAAALGACGFLEKHLPVQSLASRLLQVVSQPGQDARTARDVLVVEANPDHRAVLEYLISWLPCRPHVTHDAAEGLAVLQRVKPSAALINAHAESQRALYDACLAADIRVVCLHCLSQPVTAEELGRALRDGTAPVTVETATQQAKAALVEQLGSAAATAAWASFERNTADRCAAARAAARHGDLTELATVAHALRGAAALIGLRDLAELGGQLEAAAHSGELDQARRVVDRLPKVPGQRGRLRGWLTGS
jgi:CheY-like chemotaxis protein